MSIVTGSNIQLNNFGARATSSLIRSDIAFSTIAETQAAAAAEEEQAIFRGIVNGEFVYQVGSPPAGAIAVTIVGFTSS